MFKKNAIKKIYFLIFLISLFFIFSLDIIYKKILKNNYYSNKQSVLFKLSTELSEYINTKKKALEILTSNNIIKNYLLDFKEKEKVKFLFTTLRNLLDAEMIYMMNENGDVVLSTVYKNVTFLGKNYSFRPYFKNAIKGSEIITYAAVGITSKRRGFYLSKRIFNNKKVIGVVVIKLGLNYIEKLFKTYFPDDFQDTIALVSPEGIIFASNKIEFLYKTIHPISESEKEKIIALKRFQDTNFTVWRYFKNKNWNLIKLDIEWKDWYLMLAFPSKGSVKLLFHQKLLFIFIIIIFILFIVLMFMFTNYIKIKIESDEKLLAYQKELENIVKKRTEDLLVANKKLKSEIEKHKKTEMDLLKSKERFLKLSELFPEMIFETDIDGYITYANKKVSEILNLPFNEIKNKNFFEMVSEKERENIKNRFKKIILNNKKSDKYECKFLKHDKTEFPVSVSVAPIIDNNDKAIGMRGVVIDMTERIKQEEQNKTLLKKLEEEERIKSIGIMAGGIAHNFNNQLSIIKGYFSIMKKQCESGKEMNPEEKKKYTEKIINAIDNASFMIKRLLDFSRGEIDAIQNTKVIDISNILKDTVDMFSYNYPKIRIYADIKDSFFVKCNENELQQIFLNILINAAHATNETGKIWVSIEKFAPDSNIIESLNIDLSKSYVKICIKDNGIGMSEEVKKQIFTPFFTTKPAGMGTGLGLSSVYGIISGLKGTIFVESELKKGTTFYILLPLVDKNIQNPDKSLSKEKNNKSNNSNNRKNYNEINILLVEDNQEIRTLGKIILNKFGYNVIEAEDEKSAMNILETQGSNISIIILDFMLPEIDGIKLMKKIKKNYPHAHFILASGAISEKDKKEALNSGFDACISKPYTPTELLSTIKKIIKKL